MQITLDEKSSDRVKSIKRKYGFGSNAEVVRQALAAFEKSRSQLIEVENSGSGNTAT